MTETERLQQRALDAISRCLIRELTVPEIYFEAPWPSEDTRVDVLAIDRAGAGDVHVVEVKYSIADGIQVIPQLLSIPAQFRWIAFFAESVTGRSTDSLRNALLPPSGMGRVGGIEVVRMAGDDLGAKVLVRPERFAGSYRKETAEFIRTHEPDLSVEDLATADPVSGEYLEADRPLIQSRLTEVQRLIDSGHHEAGFLVAWSVLEAILRLLAQQEGLWIERESPGATIRSLHTYGLLEDRDYEVVRTALKTRNALVHGFQSIRQAPVTAEELKQTAERLLTRLSAR